MSVATYMEMHVGDVTRATVVGGVAPYTFTTQSDGIAFKSEVVETSEL